MLMFCIHENRAIILGIKTRKPLETLAVFGVQSFRPHVLAEDEGFEPPQTESESGVLPLHKSSICSERYLLYAEFGKSQVLFSEFSKIFLKDFPCCIVPKTCAYYEQLFLKSSQSDTLLLHSSRLPLTSKGKGLPFRTLFLM